MSEPGRHTTTPRLALALALGIAASAAALTWLGFRAVGSWRQSASSEAERRNRQAVDLLARALTRDMRGAHGRVLASPQWDEFMLETPQDMVRIVASAFARYPYPESFFAWRAAAKRPSPAGPMTFFTRSDRPPRWLPVDGNRGRFPVTVVDVAPPAAAVLDRIRSDARLGRRFAAAALGLGLGLTLRAARASARLADLRSEFVATVTHELKTPVATIRALGDTLVAGRVSEPASRHEYAQLVVQEAKRLARLIENLLAYARVTDVADVYRFEAVAVGEAAEETLAGFATQLAASGFLVQRSIPDDLPPVRADRTALRLLLDNLVDNAIRYSRDERRIEIVARRVGRLVEISVDDRGVGIPADELGKVAQKFFRGRHAGSGGTGLGLAIARRIAEDHRGRLLVRSQAGAGTTVTVVLPIAP